MLTEHNYTVRIIPNMAFSVPVACSSGPSRNTAPRSARTIARTSIVGRRAALALIVGAGVAAGASTCVADAAPAGKRLELSDDEWHERLSPESYAVLRQAGTERPFSSPLLDEKRKGSFVCAGCANAVFASKTKYDSGTGWPSFTKPLPDAVSMRATPMDRLLLQREVSCARCGGHLGHVFPAMTSTGDRFCINGVALAFVPQ